ncbi:MAG: helix-turn-helix transcriptional regulator [Bacteroidales bacterium]|nr:helix-turn-helix transcriptional regulator [Bacteroidales bacterium]
MFARFGFEKTTMNEIAIEARKGKSSLYYYFTSKEEVFQAVVEYEADMLREKLAAAFREPENLLDKMRNYIVVRFNEIIKLGNLYQALRNDFLNHLEFVQKARLKYDKLELEFFTLVLKQGCENGVFTIENPEHVAKTFHLTIKAVELPLLISYEQEVFEKQLNTIIDIVFFGLVKR